MYLWCFSTSTCPSSGSACVPGILSRCSDNFSRGFVWYTQLLLIHLSTFLDIIMSRIHVSVGKAVQENYFEILTHVIRPTWHTCVEGYYYIACESNGKRSIMKKCVIFLTMILIFSNRNFVRSSGTEC